MPTHTESALQSVARDPNPVALGLRRTGRVLPSDQRPKPPQNSETLNTLGLLSSAIPFPVGDALGVGADLASLAKREGPASSTEIGMALLGALPFFPAGAIRLAPAFLTKSGQLVPGKAGGTHFQILGELKDRGLSLNDLADDGGFIDDAGRYFTRKEALDIASKQAPDLDPMNPDLGLISEDLVFHDPVAAKELMKGGPVLKQRQRAFRDFLGLP